MKIVFLILPVFFYIVSSCFSWAGLSLNQGVHISFFEGTNTNTDHIIKTYEGYPLPNIWEGLGYIQFCSSDSGGQYNGISLNQSQPGPEDFQKIKISFNALWTDPFSKQKQELVLASSDFTDTQIIKDLYKVGTKGDNPIPGGQSYAFKIDMRSLAAGSENKLFSLQCDDPEKKYFHLFLRISYPYEKFSNKGVIEQKFKESPHRKALVADTFTPEIKFINPPESAFPIIGTSGDPLPVSALIIEICDTNPNQILNNVYLTLAGETRPLSLVSETRDYGAAQSNPVYRYKAKYELQFDSENPPLMPASESSSSFSISAEPSWPGLSMQNCEQEYEIEIQDNDAPDIEVSLKKIGSGINSVAEISIKGGIKDIPSQSSGTLIVNNNGLELTLSDPWKRGLNESATSSQDTTLVLADHISDTSKWIKISEDTRFHVEIKVTDNFDSAVIPPGNNLRDIFCNSEKISSQTFPLIFRDSGLKKNALIIKASDKAGNIRTVTYPINVIDTKVNIETIH
jgi:hypothetical protein